MLSNYPINYSNKHLHLLCIHPILLDTTPMVLKSEASPQENWKNISEDKSKSIKH